MITLPKEYTGTITSTAWISPKVIWLQIKVDTSIPFIPGQYASFLLGPHRRPLSFANLPTEHILDFAIDISPNGVCSQFAMQAKIGDSVKFLAPYGRFIIPETENRPILFTATGTGIAPIRAQLLQLFANHYSLPITLVFGNYTEKHILFREELEKFTQHYSNFTFILVLSDADSPWKGETGWVTQVVPRVIPNINDWSHYVCGNPNMVKDMQALLQQNGLDKAYLHTEQFSYAH